MDGRPIPRIEQPVDRAHERRLRWMRREEDEPGDHGDQQVQGLVDFARGAYNVLCFDMSGNMERHSLQVMQESKRVFVVCNPEAGSMFLGREKIQFLRTMGLGDRISLIVNRADQALAEAEPATASQHDEEHHGAHDPW